MTREESTPAPRNEESEDRLRKSSARLQRELSYVLFELLERKRATGLVDNVPDRFPLDLKLELFSGSTVEAPPEQLLEQMQRAVDRWLERTAAFPCGHVYCYWCQSFTCQHSTPTEAREIFAGYSATGEPIWHEFAAVLLEKRDPRIEKIYQEKAPPLTLTQTGGELTGNQLPIYGRHGSTYRLLGQVALGYVQLPSTDERARVALTFHAAELAGNRPVLNILGQLPDGRSAFEVLEESADARMTNGLTATRHALAELALRRFPRKRRRLEKSHHAMGILRKLARHLERIFRQRSRRTSHSQQRHLDRRRPAASAFGDALAAKKDAIYRDVEKNTWVVIGRKNRVHVFNDGGKHITSVVYPGDVIRARTTRGKWLSPRHGDLEAFRQALKERSRSP
jgi:hypothetical protein